VNPYSTCERFEPLRKQQDNEEYDKKLQEYQELKNEAKNLRLKIYKMVVRDDRDDTYLRNYIAPKIEDIKDGKVIMDFSSPIELRVEKIRIPEEKEKEVMELWSRVQELEQKVTELDNWLSENRPVE